MNRDPSIGGLDGGASGGNGGVGVPPAGEGDLGDAAEGARASRGLARRGLERGLSGVQIPHLHGDLALEEQHARIGLLSGQGVEERTGLGQMAGAALGIAHRE